MRTIRGWRGLTADDKGACVAFGSFDGVHLGHQRVIRLAGEAASKIGAPLGVISFEPHPWRWFHPDDPPFLLTTAHQQAQRFEALGVERSYVLPFDDHLAGLSAEEFVEEALALGLGVRHVVVGFDASFGRGRTGDGDLLTALGARFGFGVTIAPPLADEEGQKLSSTAARRALQAGDPATAAEILGRPFAIEGLVRQGRQLGRPLDHAKVLCIGDGVSTDVLGAQLQGLDCLFLWGGVHAADLLDGAAAASAERAAAFLAKHEAIAKYAMPELVW